MSETYNHLCSCGKNYEDTDPEVYFCPVCIKKRKQIAAEIDKRIGQNPRRKEVSALQAFEAQGKTLVSNTSNTKGFATFIKVKL